MNAALIRKELRGQWPFLFLGVALLVIEVLELLAKQWDLQPLSVTFNEFNSIFIFQFFISFAVGSGLLIREIDDGTLAFLDGLPLTRARAFTTKIATATAVLLCYPLGHLVFISVLHLAARESIDYDLHLSLIAATIVARISAQPGLDGVRAVGYRSQTPFFGVAAILGTESL